MAKKSKSTKGTSKTAAKVDPKGAAHPAKAESEQKEAVKRQPSATAPESKAAGIKPGPRKAAKTLPRPRDPRLPAMGTVLQKKDRQGNVRCECAVEEDGIRYKGTTFRSLSSAAMAASKDLGLGGGANGFLFWGLIKQPPRASDPVAALEHAWKRYHDRAATVLAGAKGDDVIHAKLMAAIADQLKRLERLGAVR